MVASVVRVVFEAFNSLILPIESAAGKPLSDIYACLREFARPTDLSGDNGWSCAVAMEALSIVVLVGTV